MSELNRRVAEALGYELVRYGLQDAITVPYGAILPGRMVNPHIFGVDDAANTALIRVPDYEDNLSAAIELVKGMYLELTVYADGSVGVLLMDSDNMRYKNDRYGRHPAAAICEAWLQWHAAQEAAE
jgi:hypothetical protein